MKIKINFSPNAQNDLLDIFNYINEELSEPNTANKTVRMILNSISRLEEFPRLGAPLSTIVGFENDYRFLIVKNYIVFYRFDDEIFVDRILYGRSDDILKLFPKE